MRKFAIAFVCLLVSLSAHSQSIEAPPGGITTPVVVGKPTNTADLACTSGKYWLAPIAGSTNAWRKCDNGVLSNIAGNSGGLTGVQTVTSTIQTAVTAACAASPKQGVYIPPTYTGSDVMTSNSCNATIYDMRRIGDYRGGRLSLLDFGADPNGGYYPVSNMSSGASTFSINASSHWATPGLKAGARVCMSGAGVAGADNCGTVVNYSSGTVTMTSAASTSVTQRGSYWGNDNSAAIQAAITACTGSTINYPYGGCIIDVPPGVYVMGTTVNFPNIDGLFFGRIKFECHGRKQSWFVWTGADQGVMFSAPTGTVPIEFAGCAFQSADQYPGVYPGKGRAAIAVQFAGGTQHKFHDNFFGDLYEGIKGTSSWLNLVDFNYFYGPYNAAIHWYNGGVAPINATTVSNNEFGSYHLHGILSESAGSGGANGNFYFANDIEGTSSDTIADIDLNDNWGAFGPNRFETSGSSVGGYQALIFRGTYSNVQVTFCGPSMTIAGTDNQITCSTVQGGAINDTGGFNTYRMDQSRAGGLTGPGAASATVFGGRRSYSYLDTPEFTLYGSGLAPQKTGTFNIVSSSGGATGMMSEPALNASSMNFPQATAGATYSVGDKAWNTLIGDAPQSPRNTLSYWECVGATGTTCTFNGTTWAGTGTLYKAFVYSRWHGEASSKPISATNSQGDIYFNLLPVAGTTSIPTVVGWSVLPGGTFATIYAIDPANPPDWGTSSKAVGQFTKVIASSTATTPDTLCSGQCTLSWWFKADSLALADGASVTSMTDSSSGAHNATCSGTQPIFKTNIFGGKPIVRFALTTSTCNTASFSITGPYTIFFVASHPTGQTNYELLFSGSNGNFCYFPYAGAGGAATQLRCFNNGGSGGYPSFLSNSTTDDGKQHVVSNVMQLGSLGTSGLWYDGTLLASSSSATSFLDFLTSHALTISAGAGLQWSGDLGELIVYQGALVDSDRKKIEAYLGAKWGIPATSHIIDVQNASGTSLANFDANGKLTANGGIFGFSTLAFSATPQFDFTATNTIKMTLTANVTSSTLVGASAGQPINLILCQDGTGAWTFAPPSNLFGFTTIGATASKCNSQSFIFDGTNAYATGPGQTNE